MIVGPFYNFLNLQFNPYILGVESLPITITPIQTHSNLHPSQHKPTETICREETAMIEEKNVNNKFEMQKNILKFC